MTINFADPGYDWTAVFWTGSVLIALLVVSGIFGLLYRARGYRSNANSWSFGFLIGAIAWGVLGFGIGGLGTANYVYEKSVHAAIERELADYDFTNVSLDEVNDDTWDRSIVGARDGEYFIGQLIRLDTPEGGFEYDVLELSR